MSVVIIPSTDPNGSSTYGFCEHQKTIILQQHCFNIFLIMNHFHLLAYYVIVYEEWRWVYLCFLFNFNNICHLLWFNIRLDAVQCTTAFSTYEKYLCYAMRMEDDRHISINKIINSPKMDLLPYTILALKYSNLLYLYKTIDIQEGRRWHYTI